MTDMEQALTLSGAILGGVVLTQFGRRKYSWHKAATPFVAVALVAWSYLGHLPVAGVDWVVYGVGAAVGAVFGALTSRATGVERGADGVARTRCGVGFLLAWGGLFAARLVFVALADDNAWFRTQLGTFMAAHGIVADAVAPFFVVMALVTVVVRVGLVARKVHRLPRIATRPAAVPQRVAA
jgi:hypothetical protein